jgi:hypothetical protein
MCSEERKRIKDGEKAHNKKNEQEKISLFQGGDTVYGYSQ